MLQPMAVNVNGVVGSQKKFGAKLMFLVGGRDQRRSEGICFLLKIWAKHFDAVQRLKRNRWFLPFHVASTFVSYLWFGTGLFVPKDLKNVGTKKMRQLTSLEKKSLGSIDW